MNATVSSLGRLDRMASHPAILALLREHAGKQPAPQSPRANLTFAQAVDRLLKGEKVCRLDWPNQYHYVTLPPTAGGQLQLTDQAGTPFMYFLQPDDLTVADWYVVEGVELDK